jgi:hypothetical protein
VIRRFSRVRTKLIKADCGQSPTDGGIVSDDNFQPWIEGRFEENVITTTVEQAINCGSRVFGR